MVEKENIPLILHDLIASFIYNYAPSSPHEEGSEALPLFRLRKIFASERAIDGTPDPFPYYLLSLQEENPRYHLTHDDQDNPVMYVKRIHQLHPTCQIPDDDI